MTDLFAMKADAFINPVNTQGVMGKGLALSVKEKDHESYEMYKRVCKTQGLNGGDIVLTKSNIKGYNEIFHLATKEHWRDPSRLYWIYIGLRSIRNYMEDHEMKSIVIPPIGCGLGGLSKDNVSKAIDEVFDGSDIDVIKVNF